MSFKIDKQTLQELQIMGKYKEGSLYNLFNNVKTRGGEQLLDHLFATPLSDEIEINARSAEFKYFQNSGMLFPYDPEPLHKLRAYLDMDTAPNPVLNMARFLTKRIMAALTHDHAYRQTVEGIHAAVVIFRTTAEFLERFEHPLPSVASRKSTVQDFLHIPLIEEIRSIDIYGSISLVTLARFDYALKKQLNEKVAQLLEFIAWADVGITVSRVAIDHGLNYATALPADQNLLQCINLRHPVLKKAVGNDLKMDGQNNVLFLTGANMAGKSTWMKSLGIGMYMAHLGFPIAADSFTFSIRDGICSSINTADNIDQGYSHFYAEVVRISQAAKLVASGLRLFLIFDELFKGTNVKDAYDGTLAVTRALAGYRHDLIVVSTHIIEVGEGLTDVPGVQFCFMPTVLKNGIPTYTYHLSKGITEDRQGMLIIQNEKILEMLDSCQ